MEEREREGVRRGKERSRVEWSRAGTIFCTA